MLSVQDHFRAYVKPTFTDVYRDRGEAIGVAEFETLDDMSYAIRKLDDTEFKNPFESGRITIREVGSTAAAAGHTHQAAAELPGSSCVTPLSRIHHCCADEGRGYLILDTFAHM